MTKPASVCARSSTSPGRMTPRCIAIVLLIALSGCNRSRSGLVELHGGTQPTDVQLADASGDAVAVEDSGDTSAPLDTESDANQSDTSDIDASCTHIALPASGSPPPELDDGMLDLDCRLLETRYTDQSSDYSYVFEQDGNTITRRAVRALNTNVPTVAATLNELGQVTEIVRSTDSPRAITERWRYDHRGRLILFENNFDNRAEEVRNEWDGDRLINRIVVSAGVSEAFSYSYDDSGQLTEATGEQLGREARNTYVFDDQKRPVEIQRFLGDARIMQQKWRYDRGVTLETTVDTTGRLDGLFVDSQPPASVDIFAPGNTLAPLSADGSRLGHWDRARWATIEGCRVPPSSVGFGYPSHLEQYDLGFPLHARPEGVGFAYNNRLFIDNYGDLSWYGHDGIASQWPAPVAAGLQPIWTLRTEYGEDERVISDNADYSVLLNDQVVTASQNRDFSYEEGRLVADTAVVASSTELAVSRTMRFEYDENGQLERRTLLEEAQAIAEQRWTWREDEWLSHEIDYHDASWPGFGVAPIGDARTHITGGRYYRGLRDDGRVAWAETVSPSGGATRIAYTYIDNTIRSQWSVDGATATEQVEQFDGGRLVSRTSDYTQDGVIDYAETWTYSGSGRLLESVVQVPERDPSVTTYTWACEPAP
ncbi:MAG: hypothetical protein ACI81R_002765 [Bradymonadia bacterium]|jgi:hypothetical protein